MKVKSVGRVVEINYTLSIFLFPKDFSEGFASSQKLLLGNGSKYHTPINANHSSLHNSVIIPCGLYIIYHLI